MKSIEKVIFFGSNYGVAQAVAKQLPLCEIVCERQKINRDIVNFSSFRNIDLAVINNLGEHEAANVGASTLGISCGFGLIFDHEQIERFGCGIWNIHFGHLPEYRGRHPVSWAFLNGDTEIGVSIHSINEKIDQGYLLAKGSVDRDLNDTLKEIDTKIESLLDNGLLELALRNYHAGVHEEIHEGTYHASLAGWFDSFNPAEHDAGFVFSLFKSQSVYGGVTIAGKNYTECDFYRPEFEELYEGVTIVECRDGTRLAIR